MVVAYGTEIERITYESLAASDIGEYLRAGFSVAIKPNLVVSRPASDGATTHPQVVAGILQFLMDFGISDVSIIESSWLGDDTRRAFAACGYEPLRARFGAVLFDLKKDSCLKKTFGGIEMEICRRALETDFLINVPVLKAHCQTRLTCNMKNLKGCIPDREKRRFHTLGLDKPIAALNGVIKTGYCVVDGICGDLTFEEGGNPTYANRVIVGRCPVEVDSYCAEQIGYRPQEIEYLNIAKKWGLGEFFSPATPVTELFADKKPANSEKACRVAARYEKNITQDAACSACYAALIHALHRGGGLGGEKFCVGQGFKNRTEKDAIGCGQRTPAIGCGQRTPAIGCGQRTPAIGIGNCTRGFSRHVPGCPPTAAEIIEGLIRTEDGRLLRNSAINKKN